MSKSNPKPSNNPNHPSNTPDNPTESVVKNAPVPATETTRPVVASEVVVASASLAVSAESLPADAPGRKFLSVLPSDYHPALTELVDPTPADLRAALDTLGPRERQGFESWLKKTDTKKIGFHVASNDFRIPDLRIDQGSGNDLAKPGNSMKGCTYDADGNLVTAPGQLASLLKVPERFYGAVIAVHGTRQMWPPKDEQGNVIPLPGVEDANKNQPLCSSMDRLVGSRWGACDKCSYRPFATGAARKNECKDEFAFFVVRYDLDERGKVLPFSAIYRVSMASTSVATGAKPINQRIKGWPQLWSRLFVFETVQQSQPGRSWFQWKTSLAVDSENPAGIPTPDSAQALLELLARKIDAAIFFPQLAATYAKSKGAPALPAGPENVADMNAAEAALQGMDPAANI